MAEFNNCLQFLNDDKTNGIQTITNQDRNHEVDVSRFPVISSKDIEELKSVAVNKSTSRSTKQWMNVFKSWCTSRHLENINIKTMAPEELHKVLGKKKGRRRLRAGIPKNHAKFH